MQRISFFFFFWWIQQILITPEHLFRFIYKIKKREKKRISEEWLYYFPRFSAESRNTNRWANFVFRFLFFRWIKRMFTKWINNRDQSAIRWIIHSKDEFDDTYNRSISSLCYMKCKFLATHRAYFDITVAVMWLYRFMFHKKKQFASWHRFVKI